MGALIHYSRHRRAKEINFRIVKFEFGIKELEDDDATAVMIKAEAGNGAARARFQPIFGRHYLSGFKISKFVIYQQIRKLLINLSQK